MRFLVDAQLPPALARWIVEHEHEASHVADHAMAGASDHAIWNLARSIGAVIVTKDADFADLRIRSTDGPPVIWLRVPNLRRGQLLRWFEAIFPTVVSVLNAGEMLVEVI